MDGNASSFRDELATGSNKPRFSTRSWLVVAGVGLLLASALVVMYLSNANSEPNPSVNSNGWSGTAIRCTGFPDTPEIDLWETQRGDVIDLNGQADSFIAIHDCYPVTDQYMPSNESITVDPAAHYFIVVTRSDRDDIHLVQIDSSISPVHLTAEHHFAGPHCFQTDEWRGHLLLLIEAPLDAALPDVTLQEHHLGC